MDEAVSGIAGRSAPATGARRRAAAPWTGARPLAKKVALSLCVVAALTLATELVVRVSGVPSFVFPAPSQVLAQLALDPALYARHALVTLSEAVAGLALGAAVALAFAAAAAHSRRLDVTLTPVIVASQTVPVIALAPLLVLWMGYGAPPRIVICALIAFFPMAVTAREGLRATDPRLLLLMGSLAARRRDVFWRVRVPSAVPYFAAGLRTGITLSLVGAVVAEWTGADAGLGYLVLSANARLATAQAFAAVLVITLLGLLAYGVATAAERRLVWWLPGASREATSGAPSVSSPV